MENLLGVLLVVGGILYKVYQSYQEEQEKARERMEKLKKQQKGQPQQASTPSSPQRTEKTARIPEIIYQKVEKKEKVSAIPVQETVPDEVILMQQRRLERAQKAKQQQAKTTHKRIEVEELEPVNFDLRKAIIQQAILERPYQY